MATDQPPAQDLTLQGTEWVLVSLNGNALLEGKAVTLRFGGTSVEGSGGCNTYGGSYTASGESLRLSDLEWTEMACMDPEGVMEQEGQYLASLQNAAVYSIMDDRLEIRDENG